MFFFTFSYSLNTRGCACRLWWSQVTWTRDWVHSWKSSSSSTWRPWCRPSARQRHTGAARAAWWRPSPARDIWFSPGQRRAPCGSTARLRRRDTTAPTRRTTCASGTWTERTTVSPVITVGVTHQRGETHSPSVIHTNCEVTVRHPDGGRAGPRPPAQTVRADVTLRDPKPAAAFR